MSVRTDIFADYTAAVNGASKPGWARVAMRFLKYCSFKAPFLFRIGSALRRRGWRIAGGLVGRLMQLMTGLEVGMTTQIGPGLKLPHPQTTIIGNRVKIGARARILQGVTIGGRAGRTKPDGQSQPIVGDDVLVGAGAMVLGPITIGDRVTIGANAVVLKDLPDDSVAVGVPAKVVKIGDKRIDILDRDGELGGILRDMRDRIEALESRPGDDSDNS